MYRSECWAINKKKGIKIKVVEMRIPRWICTVTRIDKIRNEYIRGNLGVTNIIRKMREWMMILL